MKKITLLLSCISLVLGAKAQTFTDGFEADTVGKLGPQSPYWTTWSKDDGGDEDVMVVDSANHTPNGSKSIYFFSEQANGGPTDCILPFSPAPLTTGTFSFSAWFKIPTDKSAYFNFQGDTVNGNIFTLECDLDEAGDVVIRNGAKQMAVATHPFDTWFKLTIDVNLNINKWSLSIDDVVQAKWTNATAQIAAVDLYPSNPSASFWVDDVSFTITPYVFPAVNGSANAAVVPVGLVGQQRQLLFTARNLGTANITSFDVQVSQNGGTPVKQTFTGLSIKTYEKQMVIFTNPFTLTVGENKFTAIISNVNGVGTDGDAIDDTISGISMGIQPAPGKMLLGEEVTATWCPNCPRGAVFMNDMAKKYKGTFAPVSAHLTDDVTKDTMALEGYANYLGITYPRVLADRSYVVDPRNIEALFLQRIVVAPEALLINGAAYDPATRELKVSITTSLQQDISGDYRIGCVITEDSVSGTTTAFDQANGYSGGALGAMGGFELLPDPVPAAQMNYNFVARAFSPTPEGLPNAYGASALAGQKITHNFVYKLPVAWDVDQLHIVGTFMESSGAVNNASYTSVKEAITNGYVPGIVVDVNQLADAPDAIKLFPNPANDFSVISLNLKKESAVSVEIYNVTGTLVQSKSYGTIKGAYNLPVETNQLTNGLYLIRVNINNQPTVLKLIKE